MSASAFERPTLIHHLLEEKEWDVIVIGGGATGLGTAVDSASRGFRTLLLEQSDFAKATSSRSTKLIHGGVRYLAQGNIRLVYEALRERGLLLKNAPHLVRRISFIIPCYNRSDLLKYYLGLKFYDWLSVGFSLGSTEVLPPQDVIKAIPTIQQHGLVGGVKYYDAQFDDARLAINLAQTCADLGGVPLNYFRVTGLLKRDEGKITGVSATDEEAGISYDLRAKVVINATGIFADEILHMDNPQAGKMIRPSQGIHMVVDREFLGGESAYALMVPRTSDKRVLFVIPWYEHFLVGTTDTPLDAALLEPQALDEEIDFLMKNVQSYVSRPLTNENIQTIFAGMRPLAAPNSRNSKTRELSRSHKVSVTASGLVTIAGGKWTTYRKMAEDTMNVAIRQGQLKKVPCRTESLHIHGHQEAVSNDHLDYYGADKAGVEQLIREDKTLGEKLHEQLPFAKAEVVWAVQNEMARTIEDVIARRTRALFINARASRAMAPRVADLMAATLHLDRDWADQQVVAFDKLLESYLPSTRGVKQ